MVLELPIDTVHLWFACPDDIKDEALLIKYECLLNEAEKRRWQRFYFAKHRHQYLVTRALVRSVLSFYSDRDPKDWRFGFNAYGKPEIAPEQASLPIRFNLSHTDGLVLCAVVLEHDVGVDIENLQRKPVNPNIAEHFFSRQEAEWLNALPEWQRSTRFFEYWTLKEAFIKAKGMGLSLPLDQFSFTIEENGPIRVSFDPRLQDDPMHWQFWQLNPTPNHIGAIALRSEANRPFQWAMNKVVPLQSSWSESALA